jgi:hypothetical protein
VRSVESWKVAVHNRSRVVRSQAGSSVPAWSSGMACSARLQGNFDIQMREFRGNLCLGASWLRGQ